MYKSNTGIACYNVNDKTNENKKQYGRAAFSTFVDIVFYK